MAGPRVVCWFSCGAASAVATALTIAKHPEAVVAYCVTGSEHPDNERFMAECAQWFGRPVQRLQSDDYADTWAVWEGRRFLSGIHGAPCTGELKFAPRLGFQRLDDIHVFGYTADAADEIRAANLRANYPEMTIATPLIDLSLDKRACLAMVEGRGLKLPAMYGLGFQNNNCIPCVKATSPNYWALVRLHFPAQFDRMARLSRDLGARLTRIADERRFIDEIPDDWPTTEAISPACDFLCHIAEQDLPHLATMEGAANA